MSEFNCKSLFLKTLYERGFVHQCTDTEELDKKANDGIVKAYIGFDATADSLHVGSLLPIMMLRHLQKTGHQPIIVMGGGTTKIGDPSGKDESRQLLTEEQIQHNIDNIQTIFSKYLSFGDAPTDAILVNNDEWLKDLNYVDFLRDYGKNFTINRMLTFDSVKMRLDREQPLTFLEFNYMIFQAFDFYELNKRYDCALQMGGSDQWGNIVNGVDLTRRMNNATVFGLTCPLMTTASGEKMGKTASGAVWLSADKLSVYDFWQYWRNADDRDVIKFMKLFTEMSLDEIHSFEMNDGAQINELKKRLAHEVTSLCHGEEAALQAAAAAEKVFQQGHVADDLPSIELSDAQISDQPFTYELFVQVGLCQSNGEARRLIKGRGAKINDIVIEDEKRQISNDDFNDEGVIKLSLGKKKHAVVKRV